MNILVLGGTGAMGEWLVPRLLEEGNIVTVTSRRERASQNKSLQYICGDAKQIPFIKRLLQKQYDAVVDFMVYETREFAERVGLFLRSTNQYVFLSSSRVYADSGDPITETSARLLDTIKSDPLLATEEYPLYKAREEDLLRSSGKTNWTIIRPYITYSNTRLQLGTYEKERWLFRAMKGKTILFSEDVANSVTSLTFGEDVACGIASIIGNPVAFGETYHIVANDPMQWRDVLKIYLDVIEEKTGKRPRVFFEKEGISSAITMGYYCQLQYDRLCNRVFDSNKIQTIKSIEYCPTKKGLRKCLISFLEDGANFGYIDWKWEAYADKMVGEFTKINEIPTVKQKIKYLIYRVSPYFWWKGRMMAVGRSSQKV